MSGACLGYVLPRRSDNNVSNGAATHAVAICDCLIGRLVSVIDTSNFPNIVRCEFCRVVLFAAVVGAVNDEIGVVLFGRCPPEAARIHARQVAIAATVRRFVCR